jgi:beta-1,4-mannooligosaccharide/beta-1,4-mannosyl-N-acetylglucosamine phosphorylase
MKGIIPMIIGENLPNIPWEDRPAGSNEIVWR